MQHVGMHMCCVPRALRCSPEEQREYKAQMPGWCMQVDDADAAKRKADSVDTVPTADNPSDVTQVGTLSACSQLALPLEDDICQSTCKSTALQACMHADAGMHYS